MRILHVVSRMHRAGIETWLMHVLRNIDRSRFQMDFLVHQHVPGHYDAEIRSLGSRLLRAPRLSNLLRYNRALKQLLNEAAPYDVIHCHLAQFSGFPLKCAHELKIPVRIAHGHSDLARSIPRLQWSRRMFAPRGRSLTIQHSTYGLAASRIAGESLFRHPRLSCSWRVLPCGIDLAPFSPNNQRDDLRREFDLPNDTLVVGHVGRFETPKNHPLLIEVAHALSRRTSKFHVVLVGDGSRRADIEAEVKRRGLSDQVTFAGVRADVPSLLTSLFDVLLLPSLWEGLPLVLVEALAAGCPAVISDVISEEADLIPSMITRLPLSAPPDQWVDAILSSADELPTDEQWATAFEAVKESRFNISASVRDLTDLYIDEFQNAAAA